MLNIYISQYVLNKAIGIANNNHKFDKALNTLTESSIENDNKAIHVRQDMNSSTIYVSSSHGIRLTRACLPGFPI